MAAKRPTKSKRPGRPREHNRENLRESLLQYIESRTIPVVSEWAYLNGVPRQKVYAMPELAEALQLAITKKEANLELGALAGKINVSMAIMSLKQIGWSDRRQVEHDVTAEAAQTFADLVKSARAR